MSKPNYSETERYQQSRTVTLVGVVLNLLLAAVKIVIGLLGHSYSLVADGIHSLADLISDGVVLFAAKHASKEADAEHPYGHARFETIATVILGLFLLAVAIGLAYDAALRLSTPQTLTTPEIITLYIAALSVISKEWLFRYTQKVALRIRSKLLEANAWHHRSDAISSIVVLIGIGGSLLGFASLDAIAAILVALMIAKIGWDLGWQSLQELADAGLEPETLDKIRDLITHVDGVQSLHLLRTRRMAANALADVHIQVNPKISVSEGHRISDEVRLRLIDAVEELSDVVVHIDPEDDEIEPSSAHLPLRGELLAKLQPHFDPIPLAEQIEDIQLHYLHGQIHLEIVLSALGSCNPPEIEAIKQAAQKVTCVGSVKITQKIALS